MRKAATGSFFLVVAFLSVLLGNPQEWKLVLLLMLIALAVFIPVVRMVEKQRQLNREWDGQVPPRE